MHICLPCHSTMATRRKRSSATSEVPATTKNRIEELEPTNFCTHGTSNPAFDPKRVLLRRLFFINEDRTKYVSVGFYPAYDYLPLVEFVVVRSGVVPKTLILCDEQVDAMAEAMPTLRDAICSGDKSVECRRGESGAFRLDLTRSRRRYVYTSIHNSFLSLCKISNISRACSVLCNSNCAITSWHFQTCCPM